MTIGTDNGLAYQRFLALKDKLSKEGLFDESKKRVVPHCCAKIGVVTSPTGAVIHDITNVALRKQPFCNIILYPVKVQGEGADAEIVNGIKYFDNTDVDAVIVGRGGGSIEDLWAFNEEVVADAEDIFETVDEAAEDAAEDVEKAVADVAEDAEEAIDKIGQVAQLKFLLADGTEVVTGDNLKDAQPGTSQNATGYVINVRFDSKGADLFG